MSQHLQTSAGLTDAQLTQIGRLEQVGNQFEGLTMKLNWATLHRRPPDETNDFLYYDDSKLVGYLALYTFNKKEAEVSAMTHPDYRRQGIFKQLLAKARLELKKRNIPDFLFICEQVSTSGKRCMMAIEARYDFSEYKMDLKKPVKVTSRPELQLRPARREDIADMTCIDEISFDVPTDVTQARLEDNLADRNRKVIVATVDSKVVGKIQALITEEETYISSFSLFPEYRSKGYGTMMLTHIVQQLVTEGHKNIVLEVATDNINALSLYERCGFQITTAYDYYRLPVNDQLI